MFGCIRRVSPEPSEWVAIFVTVLESTWRLQRKLLNSPIKMGFSTPSPVMKKRVKGINPDQP